MSEIPKWGGHIAECPECKVWDLKRMICVTSGSITWGCSCGHTWKERPINWKEPEPSEPEPKFSPGDRVIVLDLPVGENSGTIAEKSSDFPYIVQMDHIIVFAYYVRVYSNECLRLETSDDIKARGEWVAARLKEGMRVRVSENPVGTSPVGITADVNHAGLVGTVQEIYTQHGRRYVGVVFDDIDGCWPCWTHNLIPLPVDDDQPKPDPRDRVIEAVHGIVRVYLTRYPSHPVQADESMGTVAYLRRFAETLNHALAESHTELADAMEALEKAQNSA